MDDLNMHLVAEADEREASALSLDAMQLDSHTLTNINDLPDDLLRLIMMCLSDVYGYGWGKGGMNALRQVNKRLMRMVESCATRLTYKSYNETVSLPLDLSRCTRIQYITCISPDLRSLDGCPNGLKSLCISRCLSPQSLEPLRRCTELENLEIYKAHEISDLGPLASCAKLMNLFIRSSRVSDLSPLSSMQKLEELQILNCWKIFELRTPLWTQEESQKAQLLWH